MDKCDWEPCRINDKDGYKIISKINNNFIFIPFPNIKMKYKIRKLIPQWQTGISPKTKQILQRLVDKMVKVEGGTFLMGAQSTDSSALNDNEDSSSVHQVTISDFSIGKYEVTQEEWKAVMGYNPSEFKGAKKPVERVSWNDCREFIKKLNRLTGLQFRLPTEAEWEYAARGGNKSKGYIYSGSNNVDGVAWHWYNSLRTTHQVGTKRPNELGLYDMSGNVWEWCNDWYSDSYYSSSPTTNPTGPTTGSYRVLRGGSCSNCAQNSRVSLRYNHNPGYLFRNIGLRLAL